MLARAGKNHYADLIGFVGPAEDVDDFRPEIFVHRVGFIGAVDRYMGDLVGKLDTKGFVFGHDSNPRHRGWRQFL
ncbi:hypothetical protein D3C80_1755730 [compost metagenome]